MHKLFECANAVVKLHLIWRAAKFCICFVAAIGDEESIPWQCFVIVLAAWVDEFAVAETFEHNHLIGTVGVDHVQHEVCRIALVVEFSYAIKANALVDQLAHGARKEVVLVEENT